MIHANALSNIGSCSKGIDGHLGRSPKRGWAVPFVV